MDAIHLTNWQTQWAFFLTLPLAALVAFDAVKRFHWTLGPALFVALAGPLRPGPGSAAALPGALALALLVAVLSRGRRAHYHLAGQAMLVLCVVSVAATFSQWGLPPDGRTGVSGNASMNGCLIVITFYGAMALGGFYKFGAFLVAPTLAAVALTGASIPVLTLVAGLAASALTHRAARPIAGAAIPAALGVAIILQGDNFFSDSSRFETWRELLGHMPGNWWFGLGPGSTNLMLNVSGLSRGLATTMMHAHNDFLDVLHDSGLTGLGPVLLLVAGLLVQSADRPGLFATNVAYLTTAFFNFPTHRPLTAAVGAVLVWATHVGPEFCPGCRRYSEAELKDMARG